MSHNPFQGPGAVTNPQLLQNAYNNHLSQAQAQQQALQAFNQMAARQQHNWVIDGRTMTMDEFANEIWPEECAEKTFFYLKYSK